MSCPSFELSAAPLPLSSTPSPRALVQAMSRTIVGHPATKRALAVALRARARRLAVSDPALRRAAAPAAAAGILLTGPTGSGKTALVKAAASAVVAAAPALPTAAALRAPAAAAARALSVATAPYLTAPLSHPGWIPPLSRAPFAAAEATRFTEVGMVGTDLSTLVDDLANDARALVAQAAVRRRALAQSNCRCPTCSSAQSPSAAPLTASASAVGASGPVLLPLPRAVMQGPARPPSMEPAAAAAPAALAAATGHSSSPAASSFNRVTTVPAPAPARVCRRAACAERRGAEMAVAVASVRAVTAASAQVAEALAAAEAFLSAAAAAAAKTPLARVDAAIAAISAAQTASAVATAQSTVTQQSVEHDAVEISAAVAETLGDAVARYEAAARAVAAADAAALAASFGLPTAATTAGASSLGDSSAAAFGATGDEAHARAAYERALLAHPDTRLNFFPTGLTVTSCAAAAAATEGGNGVAGDDEVERLLLGEMLLPFTDLWASHTENKSGSCSNVANAASSSFAVASALPGAAAYTAVTAVQPPALSLSPAAAAAAAAAESARVAAVAAAAALAAQRAAVAAAPPLVAGVALWRALLAQSPTLNQPASLTAPPNVSASALANKGKSESAASTARGQRVAAYTVVPGNNHRGGRGSPVGYTTAMPSNSTVVDAASASTAMGSSWDLLPALPGARDSPLAGSMNHTVDSESSGGGGVSGLSGSIFGSVVIEVAPIEPDNSINAGTASVAANKSADADAAAPVSASESVPTTTRPSRSDDRDQD